MSGFVKFRTLIELRRSSTVTTFSSACFNSFVLKGRHRTTTCTHSAPLDLVVGAMTKLLSKQLSLHASKTEFELCREPSHYSLTASISLAGDREWEVRFSRLALWRLPLSNDSSRLRRLDRRKAYRDEISSNRNFPTLKKFDRCRLGRFRGWRHGEHSPVQTWEFLWG